MEANLKLTYRLWGIVCIILMSQFSWQCQNPCRPSLAFKIDWRVVVSIHWGMNLRRFFRTLVQRQYQHFGVCGVVGGCCKVALTIFFLMSLILVRLNKNMDAAAAPATSGKGHWQELVVTLESLCTIIPPHWYITPWCHRVIFKHLVNSTDNDNER